MKCLEVSFVLVLINIHTSYSQRDGDVLLEGKPNEPNAGILKVYYNGSLGYVCDDHFDLNGAEVACRNLNRSLVTAKIAVEVLRPTDDFLLDNIDCVGTESNLHECRHNFWGSENCGSREHVFVNCSKLPCDNNGGGCDQICNNHGNGKSSCSCNTGCTLQKDGKTCVPDVDECKVNNGGCSHLCVNDCDTHYCDCPPYLALGEDNSTCSAEWFSVDCSSPHGMTVIMEKTDSYFLPSSFTLTNTSCQSESNSTHIWIYSNYSDCGTKRKVVNNEIIYSNEILDSKTKGEILFYDSIRIPFQCGLAINASIIQNLRPVQNKLIMRVDRHAPMFRSRIALQAGDRDYSPEVSTNTYTHGDTVFAKISFTALEGLTINPQTCDVYSVDRSISKNVINNGQPSSSLVSKLPSDEYRFSYHVFSFRGKGSHLYLTCNSSLNINSLYLKSIGSHWLITEQQINGIKSRLPSSHSVAIPQIIPSSDVELVCGTTAMTLSLKPSSLSGISATQLCPVRTSCQGFSVSEFNGKYVYTIPLFYCDANIKKKGDSLIITNALQYCRNDEPEVRVYSEVVLTHSCKYPLANYMNTISYSVTANRLGFNSKQKGFFDVSLDLFSDATFKKVISNGGSISMAEGSRLFGDIGVTTTDPDLRVALDECKVTKTSTANDPKGHVVVKDGCPTQSFGTQVLSENQFSILTHSFASHSGKNVYLHCSVLVCGASNRSRCERKCPSVSPGDVIGRREAEQLPAEKVHVSAGPILVI